MYRSHFVLGKLILTFKKYLKLALNLELFTPGPSYNIL